MAREMPDHRDIKFPPAALEYRRRLVEAAPPFGPRQEAIIRAACTKPRIPAKKAPKRAA